MKIKYDKKTAEVLLIIICVSFVLFLAGLIVMHFEIAGLELLFVFGIYVGGGLLIYSVSNLVAAICYFRRLKKHGYELPYDKKIYGNNLNNVPFLPTLAEFNNVSNTASIESLILALLYLAIFVFANIWNIQYIVCWYKYINDNAVFMLCVQVIFDLCWLIGSIIYFRQRSNEKYRDDVELDFSRKERSGIEKGIFLCIVLLAGMIFLKTMVVNMSDYVFHSRQNADQCTIEDIQRNIYAELSEMNQKDADMGKNCDSYIQMTEGCYISDWNEPKDVFANDIADSLGISDYSELVEAFYTSDGRAQIYVKISGEQVYVRLDNPLLENHGTEPLYETGGKLD